MVVDRVNETPRGGEGAWFGGVVCRGKGVGVVGETEGLVAVGSAVAGGVGESVVPNELVEDVPLLVGADGEGVVRGGGWEGLDDVVMRPDGDGEGRRVSRRGHEPCVEHWVVHPLEGVGWTSG